MVVQETGVNTYSLNSFANRYLRPILLGGVLALLGACGSNSNNVQVRVVQNTLLIGAGLSFQPQLVGTHSIGETIAISNQGTTPIINLAIAVTGSDAFFVQSNNCGSTLAIGGACLVTVVFTPVSNGAASGSVTFDYTGGTTQSASLNGVGTSQSVSFNPSTLTFNDQLPPTTSAIQTITVTNNGTAPLSSATVVLAGANLSEFAQTNDCGVQVAVGGVCTISVTFTPAAPGAAHASLSIISSVQSEPIASPTVTLSGNGSQLLTLVLKADGQNPSLDSTVGQRHVNVVPLSTGDTAVSYTLNGIGPGSASSWFFLANTQGLAIRSSTGVALPTRTSVALDAAASDATTIYSGAGVPFASGSQAVFAMGHATSGGVGGNAVLIDGAGVATPFGGNGAYETAACAIGTEAYLTSESGGGSTVTYQTSGFIAPLSASPIAHAVASSPYTVVSPSLMTHALACQNGATTGAVAVLARLQPGQIDFDEYAVAGSVWTRVNSAVTLNTVQVGSGTINGATLALNDTQGVLIFSDVDGTTSGSSQPRRQLYYVRFTLTLPNAATSQPPITAGIQLIDTVPVALTSSTSYEGLDGAVVYSGTGSDFYITAYQAGNSASGQPSNTVQRLTVYDLNFGTGAVTAYASRYQDTNWTGSLGAYQPNEAPHAISMGVSCDGNVYVGSSVDGGTGQGLLQLFRLPVSANHCVR